MQGNIPHLLARLKNLLAGDLYLVALVILVGMAGFGLGRLSTSEENRLPVTIHGAPAGSIEQIAGAAVSTTREGVGVSVVEAEGMFVASKNSTKYHFPWCPGAQRIKESNKIWFASKEEARRAGYTPAANCKGLE